MSQAAVSLPRIRMLVLRPLSASVHHWTVLGMIRKECRSAPLFLAAADSLLSLLSVKQLPGDKVSFMVLL